ncbi:DUF2288 domain-containing protein [Neisseria weaveri]|uniref:DUF2288 domain-containing protein n=1 Tax=Neisseria weaveri TaxID=28091 RepID=UPI000D2FF898|nr:DUF2288 domain-containing protein [Neisseria weaveri]
MLFKIKDKRMQSVSVGEKLNLETAKIHWDELQTHFARGAAVYVSEELDLINVAEMVAADNASALRPLMETGKFGLVSEDQASRFLGNNQAMWAVVVAPWVLVQPCCG